MVRAGSSPEHRPASGLVWLLPAALIAAAAAAAVSVVRSGARVEVAWCGAVATVLVAVAAFEAARRGRALADLRGRYARDVAALREQVAQQEAQTVQLAEVLLPQSVARLQQGEFVEEVLKDAASDMALVTPEFHAARLAVLRWVLQAVEAQEGLRESAQRAFVNIARRVQAIVHQQAHELREMETRHGANDDVIDDLLRVDHRTALVGRLADSIAVLGGARPGRQWSNAVPLYSVLRGAMSRILDYQRVELRPVPEVAVVGPAVEPLIHALAELLDNGTRYSPPQSQVHLTAVEVQAGIAIEIEDGGLSLSEEGRERAEKMLSEAQAGIDLNDLGETPRLGLAVVGRLAQANGFQVSLRPSAYLGVRAVLIVPKELITTAPATGRAHGIGAASGPIPAPASAAPPAAGRPVNGGPRPVPTGDDEAPVVTARTALGLPKRTRRSPDPAAAAAEAAPRVQEPAQERAQDPAQEHVQPGQWIAAFTAAVGESPTSRSRNNSDESSGEVEQL